MNVTVEPAPMCQKHQALLVQQANIGPDGPWRATIVMAQIVLFQIVSCDKAVHARIAGDITRIGELGCLACLKPDAFGEVVEAAKDPNPGAFKALGESHIAKARVDGS